MEWAREVETQGAGEILLTSMDRDGTGEGYDLDLTRAVSEAVSVPVIASGGAGTLEHLHEGVTAGGADAVLGGSDVPLRSATRWARPRPTCASAACRYGSRHERPGRAQWDAAGLIPAVVQETGTGEVLMVAWMDRDALDATLQHRRGHYWSRSRQAQWRKGETSGHVQHVDGLYADCDRDTPLVQVHQEGGGLPYRRADVLLHARGRRGTGGRAPAPARPTFSRCSSARSISRRVERPEGSYVARLFDKGDASSAGRSARRPPRWSPPR